jgi:hypothetical protein
MAVALHVAADDGPVEDVERSEPKLAPKPLVPSFASSSATVPRAFSCRIECAACSPLVSFIACDYSYNL